MFDSEASSHKSSSHNMCHSTSNDNSSSLGTTAPPRGPPQASVMGDLVGPNSPVSTTSAFLLGIHNYKALDDINLPEFVREHQATLTFPEKLMLLLTYVDQEYKTKGADADNTSISWILDGRAFVIRSKEDVVKHLLPMFFRQAKFASFTRKLYRWGFRQVSVAQERTSSSRREMIFGHEFFQRDNKSLMARMRSVTAAGTRRAIASMSVVKPQNDAPEGQNKVAIEPKKVDGQPFPSKMILAAPGALLAPMPGAYQCNNHMLASCGPAKNHQVSGAPPLAPGPFVANSMHQSLSDALVMSHQERSLALGQQHLNTAAPIVETTKEGAQGKTEGENHQATAAPTTTPATMFSSSPFPHVLTNSAGFPPQVAATQERIRANQQGGGKPSESANADPNAYMRAAVDMLLRYAS